MQVEQTIREHALGARMFMKQQATAALRETENVNETLQGWFRPGVVGNES